MDGEVVKRNGNFFLVKKGGDGHYYTAMILGSARVQAWHRTTIRDIKENFEHVPDYDGSKEKFKW